MQQYFQADSLTSDTDCFDPTKHAVTLVYLVRLKEEPTPQNEASSVVWFSETPPAQQCGYNQQVVLAKLFELLKNN